MIKVYVRYVYQDIMDKIVKKNALKLMVFIAVIMVFVMMG